MLCPRARRLCRSQWACENDTSGACLLQRKHIASCVFPQQVAPVQTARTTRVSAGTRIGIAPRTPQRWSIFQVDRNRAHCSCTDIWPRALASAAADSSVNQRRTALTKRFSFLGNSCTVKKRISSTLFVLLQNICKPSMQSFWRKKNWLKEIHPAFSLPFPPSLATSRPCYIC